MNTLWDLDKLKQDGIFLVGPKRALSNSARQRIDFVEGPAGWAFFLKQLSDA